MSSLLPCIVMQVLLRVIFGLSSIFSIMMFSSLLSQLTVGLSLHAGICSPLVQAATGSLPSGPARWVASSDAASAWYLNVEFSENGSKVM